MKRPLSVVLIATICFTCVAKADDKLPPAVKVVLDKAVREVKRNRQDFDKANAKPLAEAKKALEDQAKKLLEAGKVGEAAVILEYLKTLEADVMKMANAPAPAPVPANMMAEIRAKQERRANVMQNLCATKWIHQDKWTYAFSPDGRYVLEDTTRKGTYSLTEDEKIVLLHWDGETRVDVIVVGERPGSWMAGDGTPFRPSANGQP